MELRRGGSTNGTLRGADIGTIRARELFQDEDSIGREVRIRNVPFQVIGLLARKGQSTAGWDQDDSVLVPLEAARRVLGNNQVKSKSVTAILIKVREGLNMNQTEEEAHSLLR